MITPTAISPGAIGEWSEAASGLSCWVSCSGEEPPGLMLDVVISAFGSCSTGFPEGLTESRLPP